ncbi:MAG TPA: TIR domain-containing protein, partial [Planctomycetaceae bacterium]|nr:TIR domain-containing protein [Planctomycetaceae bacterium]
MPSTIPSDRRQGRIFISYSHRGHGPQWKAALLKALAVFERQHLLDIWQDGKIRVSSLWNDDIHHAMNSAQLAIVLLTPEALESEYILEKEFPRLRERWQEKSLSVFPVVCEPCDWKSHDWLRAIQAPNNSNPLSELTESGVEHTFRQLSTAIAEELSRIALAELPPVPQALATDHVYLDCFPLSSGNGLREEKLIGREQELALLDLAFAQHQTAIVSLVAWGGVGKTMLVQHWLRRLQRAQWRGVKRVYAWSFFSQGTKEDRQASEDLFLAYALEWFGVQCEPTISPWDKGRLLAEAVSREPTLLILDGIEPLQYPPGPMGGQLRAPGVQSLLKRLARNATEGEQRGLCLATTREPLTDLADFQRREGSPWGSVLRVDLGNLTDEAGAALLHHAGANRAGAAEIKPDDKELLAASRDVDGHALTLNLLGRFLARAHGGDIRRRDLVKFEEADRQVQGGTTFKMLATFVTWFANSGDFGARQLAILRMLGLFDRPADSGCIAELRKPRAIAGLTEPLFRITPRFLGLWKMHQPLPDEDWNTALSFLCDFGLVSNLADAGEQTQSLDCHPVIREFFSVKLRTQSPGTWESANLRVYDYLRAKVPIGTEPSLKDLDLLYQAVAHGCHAGLEEKTCTEVYSDRILQFDRHYSLRQFGVFGTDLVALACFFEQPWSQLSSEMSPGAQSFVFNEVGTRLRALGRIAEAIQPLTSSLRIDLTHNEWRSAAISCCNLSDTYLALGNIIDATSLAKRAVEYANRCSVDRYIHSYRESNAFVMVTCSFPRHAYTYFQGGDRTTAGQMFHESERLQGRYQPDYPLLYADVGFMYCDHLLAPAERAGWNRITEGAWMPVSRHMEPHSTATSSEGDSFDFVRTPPVTPIECCRNVAERMAKLVEWRE